MNAHFLIIKRYSNLYSCQTSNLRMNRRRETYNTATNHKSPKHLKCPVSFTTLISQFDFAVIHEQFGLPMGMAFS